MYLKHFSFRFKRDSTILIFFVTGSSSSISVVNNCDAFRNETYSMALVRYRLAISISVVSQCVRVFVSRDSFKWMELPYFSNLNHWKYVKWDWIHRNESSDEKLTEPRIINFGEHSNCDRWCHLPFWIHRLTNAPMQWLCPVSSQHFHWRNSLRTWDEWVLQWS